MSVPTEADRGLSGASARQELDRTARVLPLWAVASLEDVQANFEAYGLLDDRVRFLKGWFKATLPTAPIGPIAVMRLDGDYYDSTMDALTSLYDKLSLGGYCIIDDYGEDGWTYCKQAVDVFRAERGISDELVKVDTSCWYWRRSR
jgi:hypothetical protein